MTFASTLPSVSFPAMPLTPYILERAGRLADKAALIDGVTGRSRTYSEFEDAVRRQAGGWLDVGLAKGEVVSGDGPQFSRLRGDVSRRRTGRRCDHHGQPDVHGGRSPPPTRRLGRDTPCDDSDDVAETARPRPWTRRSTRCMSSAMPTALRRSPLWSARHSRNRCRSISMMSSCCPIRRARPV